MGNVKVTKKLYFVGDCLLLEDEEGQKLEIIPQGNDGVRFDFTSECECCGEEHTFTFNCEGESILNSLIEAFKSCIQSETGK